VGTTVTSEEFEGALQAAGVGVWAWDVATGVVHWSEEAHAILGFDVGEFDGRLEAYVALVHPDDREYTQLALEQALSNRSRTFYIEHRLVRKDGAFIWVEGRGGVRVDAAGNPVKMLGTVVEIGERKRAEERLRQSEERYRLFTALASDYVYEIDLTRPQLAPMVVAGSFERTVGYSIEDVERLGGWVNIIHPDDRAAATKFAEELQRGTPVLTEYRFIDALGNVRWLRDRIHPQIDADGCLRRLTGGVTDITEHKQLEERLVRAQRLDAMARLAGSVAHDFNNLLLVLYGVLDELDGDASSNRTYAPSILQEMRTALERTEQLTRSLLTFGRKQVTRNRAIGLNGLVRDSLPLLSRVADERVELCTVLGDDEVVVAADPGQLQLMLLNLCVNARDALPNGGKIVIKVSEVQWSRDAAGRPAELGPGNWGCLSVRDNGTGMSDAVRRRVFEPFFTTKPPGLGTGLGLATVHGAALQMGGTVAVESGLGTGSEFMIYLPLADATESGVTESSFRRSVGGRERLLLVEDDAAVRRTLVHTLKQRGYTVLTAESAEEALGLPAAELTAVDLVISDVRLPGMNGLALCRELMKGSPRLRCLLISGYLPDDQVQHELSKGQFPFLPKPFSPEGLALRIREVLDGPALGAST